MIIIYDNGGKTIDRYTAINTKLKSRRVPGGWLYEAIFSGNDPRGMSGHCEAMRGSHLGKKISYNDLPAKVRLLFSELEV